MERRKKKLKKERRKRIEYPERKLSEMKKDQTTNQYVPHRNRTSNPVHIFKEKYSSNIRMAGIEIPPEKYLKILTLKLGFAAVFLAILYAGYLFWSGEMSLFRVFLAIVILFIVLQTFFFFKISLNASTRVKKMETMFPDVIQLMASNLRAGMTIDHAFVLSARPEFHPLDKEIIRAGKDIATGKDIALAFKTMAARIGSEKISKVVSLFISGIRSGGNISLLLEQTGANMREKDFIEKRIASNVLMYVIFIFFAVAVGAPLLFGLSSILVEVLVKIIGSLPAESLTANLPFTLSKVEVDPAFIKWFSLVFILVTDFLASLILGLVNKGEEKAGLKFFIPLLVLSLLIFFLVRVVLSKFLLDNLSLNV